jgi:GMP synthase (glutamine-hydrolysing)
VPPAPAETHADLAHWYGADPVDLDIARPRRGEALPPPDDYDGFVISGSPCSLTEMEPWMETTTRYARHVIDMGKQVLGVCFGHQMIGLAFGGRVVKNPAGRIMGTVKSPLTPEGLADPLFRGMGPEISVHTTHQDIVVDMPPGVVCLATYESVALQAMRVTPTCRGVQFHPELNETQLRGLATKRAEALDREGIARGLAPGEGLQRTLAGIVPTSDGRVVLRNFLDLVRDDMSRSRRPASAPAISSGADRRETTAR